MLYEKMLDIAKIEQVFKNIKGKTKHKEKIVNFKMFYMTNIYQIYEVLRRKQYKHGKYNIFLVKEHKYRLIMSENLSDKIVNHLFSNEVLLPIIEPRLVFTNVATRKGKGTSMGLKYTKKYINEIRRKCPDFYVLKCDIKKYFYNIDHNILLKMVAKIIPDKDCLRLLKSILDVTNENVTNDVIASVIEQEKMRLKKTNNGQYLKKCEELDSIPFYKNGKGLPIGNVSSQILAIFYLNDLDHYIKEVLRCKYFVRYMDDIVIFHEDREYLKFCLEKIKFKLAHDFALELHPNKTKIFSFHQGLSFLGYRFFVKNNRLIILMRPSTKKKIAKNIKRVNKKKPKNRASVLASYRGYFMNCSCASFLKKHNFTD